MGIFDIDAAETKCGILMSNEWKEQVQSKPKLRTYRMLKEDFGTEPYVLSNIPKYKRSLFAQFRSGILPLHIETGRYSNI